MVFELMWIRLDVFQTKPFAVYEGSIRAFSVLDEYLQASFEDPM